MYDVPIVLLHDSYLHDVQNRCCFEHHVSRNQHLCHWCVTPYDKFYDVQIYTFTYLSHLMIQVPAGGNDKFTETLNGLLIWWWSQQPYYNIMHNGLRQQLRTDRDKISDLNKTVTNSLYSMTLRLKISPIKRIHPWNLFQAVLVNNSSASSYFCFNSGWKLRKTEWHNSHEIKYNQLFQLSL